MSAASNTRACVPGFAVLGVYSLSVSHLKSSVVLGLVEMRNPRTTSPLCYHQHTMYCSILEYNIRTHTAAFPALLFTLPCRALEL